MDVWAHHVSAILKKDYCGSCAAFCSCFLSCHFEVHWDSCREAGPATRQREEFAESQPTLQILTVDASHKVQRPTVNL